MTVRADRLAFGHPGRPVGQDVTFETPAGRVLALLGPNGSGKTTLFRTLMGLLPVQGGTVWIDGRDVAAMGRDELARTVAYVPQASNGYFPFTVLDTVLMGRAARLGLFASPGRKDRRVALDCLDRLGIAGIARQAYTRLSGGQRQMVLIARALAQETPWLMLDEPTASLDFGNQARVLGHVRSLAASGIGVVLSTHDPGHALQVGHRAALLKDGALVAFGPPPTVITPSSLRTLYGVDTVVGTLAADRDVAVAVSAPVMPG